MKKLFSLLLCSQLLLVTSVMAQESDEDDFIKKTRNDMLIVAGAGAAGAILGLSTLSFVERPSEHVRNVWTGAALGIIGGVIFVAYSSAQQSSEELQSSRDFNTHERVAWHYQKASNLTLPEVQFGTQFWSLSF